MHEHEWTDGRCPYCGLTPAEAVCTHDFTWPNGQNACGLCGVEWYRYAKTLGPQDHAHIWVWMNGVRKCVCGVFYREPVVPTNRPQIADEPHVAFVDYLLATGRISYDV